MADKKQYGLTSADMINLVNQDPRSNTSFFTETAIKTKFPYYNLFIEFPTIRNPTYRAVMFPAYISSPVTDTYTPSYSDAGPVFGRMDPIPKYSKTSRAIKVDFNIPASSIDDAREIRKKLDIIAKNTYPVYQSDGQSTSRLVIKKPPLIRIKFGNIICNPSNEMSGLLGYLAGAISISHDLSGGVFTTFPGQEIYAKKYSLSLSMNVLHEFTPGFNLLDHFPDEQHVMIYPGTIDETEKKLRLKIDELQADLDKMTEEENKLRSERGLDLV